MFNVLQNEIESTSSYEFLGDLLIHIILRQDLFKCKCPPPFL